MARFEVRLIAGGRARTIEILAPDAGAARTQLSARGRVVRVRRCGSGVFARGLGRNERHILFIRLAAMLESRVGLVDALRRIASSFRGHVRKTAERLADAVETGDDLAAAMARLPRDFPSAVVALVRAGGFGEGTPAALRAAAAFEAAMVKARQGFRSGLWIAILYALLGTVIMVGTAHWLTPMLLDTEVFRTARAAVDVGWVERASDLSSMLAAMFLGALSLLGGLTTLGRRLAPRPVERLILTIPLYRDLALGVQSHVTMHELALLVGGGVGLERALTLSAEAAAPGALRDDLLAASRAVTQGQPWPDALRTVHPTDRAALAAAENRTEVARTLKALAQQHHDLYFHAVAVVEPVLRGASILFLGIAGVVLFGLTILPVLQLADSMSRQF